MLKLGMISDNRWGDQKFRISRFRERLLTFGFNMHKHCDKRAKTFLYYLKLTGSCTAFNSKQSCLEKHCISPLMLPQAGRIKQSHMLLHKEWLTPTTMQRSPRSPQNNGWKWMWDNGLQPCTLFNQPRRGHWFMHDAFYSIIGYMMALHLIPYSCARYP